LEIADGEARVALGAGTGRVLTPGTSRSTLFTVARGIAEKSILARGALGRIATRGSGYEPRRASASGSVADTVGAVAVGWSIGGDGHAETFSSACNAVVASFASRITFWTRISISDETEKTMTSMRKINDTEEEKNFYSRLQSGP
jgi:hypothetical protein